MTTRVERALNAEFTRNIELALKKEKQIYELRTEIEGLLNESTK